MDTSRHSQSVHEPKSPPIIGEPSSLQGNENTHDKTFDKETNEELPAPVTAVETPQRWNRPRINVPRFLVTLLGFFLMGMNDAVIGALLPYLEIYYNISYMLVSLLFLAPFVGYTTAALLNNKIHVRFGQLGIAVIAPSCKLVGYVITCIHPPYPVLPIIFILAGFGQGLEDGAWNAWIGNMANANELLGLLHGLYGLGAAMAPLIATAMITQGHLPWYTFYYIMVRILKVIISYGFVRTPFFRRCSTCRLVSTVFWDVFQYSIAAEYSARVSANDKSQTTSVDF